MPARTTIRAMTMTMKTLRNNGAAAAARRRPLTALFEVAGRRQTYRNGIYLLSSFPLGLVYFFMVVPGLAVSIGTAMFVGVPLLLLLCSIWWRLGAFERLIARRWLGVDIAPPPRPQVERVLSLARLISPTMWKIVGYLLLKLPFGVVAYALGASLLFICFRLLIPSCAYLVGSALGLAVGGSMQPGTVVQSIVMAAAGLVLLPLSLHAMNGLAAAWGRVARYLLGVNPLAVQLSAAVATAELAQEKAARAEQSRRELIVNVSHELRTPIANIRGHVESLLMATDDGAAGVPVTEQRAYLNIVHREAERLSALVDDLLALARADAGELRLEIAPVSVGEVIDEIYQSMAPLAKRERQVTVIRDVRPGLPPALADRRRLAQVVLNLVRNAISYTPTGGIVSLSLCAVDTAHLALTVADTGIGIPPDELEHIFERFYRTDASRARATGGFGLGLAIVRDLVGAMGGSITVESTVDKGSNFRILLPVAATGPVLSG